MKSCFVCVLRDGVSHKNARMRQKYIPEIAGSSEGGVGKEEVTQHSARLYSKSRKCKNRKLLSVDYTYNDNIQMLQGCVMFH